MLGCVLFWMLIAVIRVHSESVTNTMPVTSDMTYSDTNVTVANITGMSTESSVTQSDTSLQPSTGGVSLSTVVIHNRSTQTKPVVTTTNIPLFAGSTQPKPVVTTTKSTSAWKDVSFGMFGVISVLLIALVITIICTYKLKQKLRQCSKTLYPIAPGQQPPHEYVDLEGHDGGKHHGNVELTNMHVHHEEEFDTPTFPPTPTPDRPPRKHRPPSPPISDPPSQQRIQNERQGNNKANGKIKNQAQIGGIPNPGFEMEEATTARPDHKQQRGGVPGIDVNNMYDHDGGLYEEYDENKNSNTSGLAQVVLEDGTDMEEPQPYEEPIRKSAGQQVLFSGDGLHRQDSSTGLPEVPSRDIPGSQRRKHKVPLEMTEEDAFESADFDPSGIPLATMPFDESQFFGDFDTNETHENFDIDLTEGRDSFVDIPNHHYHIHEKESQNNGLNNLQTDAPVDITQEKTDEFKTEIIPYNTESDEPGLYESYEAGFAAPKYNNTFEPTKQNFDQDFDIVDGFGEENNVTAEEEIGNEYENTLAPVIPPRRDIIRRQSEGDNAASIETGANIETGTEDNVDSSRTFSFDSNMSENDGGLRTGKNLRGSKIRKLEKSYFLDINDKTTMIDELGANPDHVITGEPILDVSIIETNNAMASNDSAGSADVPVKESEFGNSNGMPNLLSGDNVNIADQPMTDMLVDYENFQTGSYANLSTDNQFDFLNGDIPNDEHVDNDNNGVDYENTSVA